MKAFTFYFILVSNNVTGFLEEKFDNVKVQDVHDEKQILVFSSQVYVTHVRVEEKELNENSKTETNNSQTYRMFLVD